MEHIPAEHLYQLRRGLGHQDLGQGLQVGGSHDGQPCDENSIREKLGTVRRIARKACFSFYIFRIFQDCKWVVDNDMMISHMRELHWG